MAGVGKRFKKEKFSTIKPLIKIDERSILEESIIDLPFSKKKIIILNKRIYDKYSIIRKIIKNNNFSKLLLKKKTLGQSDTCYKTKNLISQDEDLMIHSCDYIMKYSLQKFKKIKSKFDVLIFTYKLKSALVKNYNDFAYCKEKKGKITEITEKKTISKYPNYDQMVIGTFWFKKSKDFFLTHEKSLKRKKFINNELYVANNINYLIKKNRKVGIFEVDFWKNLGDFFSYNQYIYWKNYFLNKKL